MEVTLLLCGFVLLLLYLIRLFLDFKRRDKMLSVFPTPPGHFLFGHTFQVNTNKKILSSLRRYQDIYGDTVRLKFGPLQILVTSEVKFVEALLLSNTSSKKSEMYKIFRRWLGTAMGISSGERWSKLRKSFEPAFRLQVMKNFIATFSAKTQVFLRKLEEANGEAVDLQPNIETLLLDIICATTLGYELNSQIQGDSEYRRSLNTIKASISDRIFSPIKQLDFYYYSTRQGKKEIKAVDMVRGFSQRIIASRRKYLKEGKSSSEVFLIDLLFDAELDGRPLTDVEINDEVNTFMFAGHDTTAVALSYLFYLLSKHPDVQKKVVEELQTILSSGPSRKITYEDLLQMRYLETVIYETMRLYTPIGAVFRTLLEDVEVGPGRVVPKGTQVIVSIKGMHRNPKVYPDPEKFDPERFTPEAKAERSPCSFLTFSIGLRSCIGQKYAMMEIKVIAAEVLRKFELLPVEGHTPEHLFDIVVTTTNGLPVKFAPRNFAADNKQPTC